MIGTPLVVQWLRCHTSTAGVMVPSLAGDQRSHMLFGETKNRKKKKTISNLYLLPGIIICCIGHN